MSGFRPCEQEWSMKKATEVRELIEDLTGEACPCDQGRPCPLLPGVRDTRVPMGESGEVRKIA